jgi:hypothetical protein
VKTPVLLCCGALVLATLAPAQQRSATVTSASAVAPAAAPAPAALTGPIERREYTLCHVGREITNRAALAATVGGLLTPNVGSFEYRADSRLLIVRDRASVLDAVAAVLARADQPRTQIQLDIRLVRIAPARAGAVLPEGGELAAGNVAVVDSARATAMLRLLKGAGADIVQAPQIVGLAGECATILVANKPRPRVIAGGGGVMNELGPDGFEVTIVPAIVDGGEVAMQLDLRTECAMPADTTFSLPLRLASGATAVFRKDAGPDRGVIVLVTPMVIADAAPASPR